MLLTTVQYLRPTRRSRCSPWCAFAVMAGSMLAGCLHVHNQPAPAPEAQASAAKEEKGAAKAAAIDVGGDVALVSATESPLPLADSASDATPLPISEPAALFLETEDIDEVPADSSETEQPPVVMERDNSDNPAVMPIEPDRASAAGGEAGELRTLAGDASLYHRHDLGRRRPRTEAPQPWRPLDGRRSTQGRHAAPGLLSRNHFDAGELVRLPRVGEVDSPIDLCEHLIEVAQRPRIAEPPATLDAVPFAGAEALTAVPRPDQIDLSPPQAMDAKRGGRVTDTFLDTDIRQAIQSLANQAGAAVIIDEQIRGTTSAVIDDEPFESALRKVLMPLDYHYRQVDGEYLIGSANPESAMFGVISQRLDYMAMHRTPEELLELMPKRMLPYIRVGAKGNRIIVEAPQALATRILGDLQQSDQPVPQVVLEALICVYSPETEFRFGFDSEHGVRLNGGEAAHLALNGLAISGGFSHIPSTVTNLNDFTFTSSLLRAMEKDGYVMIRAAPRVMAKSGEQAEINIGRETFFSLQPNNIETVLFRQDIEKVESGIVLEITPVVRGSQVTVDIERAEVSEDIRSEETSSGRVDQFPIINRRKVSTTVHVDDGNTIVIGGLMQRQEIDRVSKVVLLGDLPVLGKLFRRIDREAVEVEVAIFISPSIVHPCCGSAPPSPDCCEEQAEMVHGILVD